jgi:hypothetical protein
MANRPSKEKDHRCTVWMSLDQAYGNRDEDDCRVIGLVENKSDGKQNHQYGEDATPSSE